MSAVPPLNGKSAPLPRIFSVWATPRSSMMSPPATRVHVSVGSKTGTSAGCGSARSASQSAAVFTASTPKSDLPPQPSARTPGPTSSARSDAEPLPVLRQVLRQRRGIGREDEARSPGRPVHAEAREGRIRLARDELEALPGRARPGDRRPDVVAADRLGRRPELGDRARSGPRP